MNLMDIKVKDYSDVNEYILLQSDDRKMAENIFFSFKLFRQATQMRNIQAEIPKALKIVFVDTY